MTDENDHEFPRDGTGKFIRTAEQMELDQRAAALRARSKPYRDIAAELGVSIAAAQRMVERAMADVSKEPAERVIAMELVKLDRWEAETLAVLERHHVKVDHGRLITISEEEAASIGEGAKAGPLLDDGPVLAAIDRLIKIQTRRAALLGLDASQGLELTGKDGGPLALTVQGTEDVIRGFLAQRKVALEGAGEGATS